MQKNMNNTIKKIKKVHPLGKFTPWVWNLEPSFGCNLKCGHCCAELIPEERKGFMSKDTWIRTFEIIQEVSPTVRMDICGAVGEPLLHPDLYTLLQDARKIVPLLQIQITTNGTQLLKGKYTIKGLLDAGANIVYIDQYGPEERYEQLAKESEYPFYSYYNKPKNAINNWEYNGPHIKQIVLMQHPAKWPRSRHNANLLGNWYNNLNWEKARLFKMYPLFKPLQRRCNQIFIMVNITAAGNYIFCCQDGLHETEGKFGGVYDGLNGFYKFWFGKDLQIARKELRNKNRGGIPYACAKCNITFSRCDFTHWDESDYEKYYNGEKYIQI